MTDGGESNLPTIAKQLVRDRADFLLKGEGDYKGVDEKTREELETIILDNAGKPIEEVIQAIVQRIPEIAFNRATLISETEVAYIVEQTRFVSYRERGHRFKRWLTVADDLVRASHRTNEDQGAIPIADNFSNGNSTAGEDPRCRCTVIYAREVDDINDDLTESQPQ